MVIETMIIVGVMTGCGIYLMFSASFVRFLFGFILMSNAANIFLLSTSGNPTGKQPPVLSDGTANWVDPLPQALILTAIVIGFGVAAYFIVYLYRLFLDYRSTDAWEILEPERERTRSLQQRGASTPAAEGADGEARP